MEDVHVVLGASGGWGSALVHELVNQGKKVRGTSRSGKADVPPEVEMVAIDINNRDQLRSVVKGAVKVYNCINIPYDKWVKGLVPITENIISVIEELKVPILITDNLYMYPESVTEPLHENMPWNAETKKGRLRAKIAGMYLEAHASERIEVVIVRAPDFFGPRVGKNSFYGERIFRNAIRNKKASIFGNPEMPHQIAYTPDLARASIMVAEDEKSYGQVWHLPSDEAIPQREFVQKIYHELGRPVKIGSISRGMVWVWSLFSGVIREVGEMLYEFEKPYLVSHKKFMDRYNFRVTPMDEAIQNTIEWFKNNS